MDENLKRYLDTEEVADCYVEEMHPEYSELIFEKDGESFTAFYSTKDLKEAGVGPGDRIRITAYEDGGEIKGKITVLSKSDPAKVPDDGNDLTFDELLSRAKNRDSLIED